VSEQLARDVRHLLLRFGIVAKLRFRQIRYRGTRRPAYELRVLRQEDIGRFVNEIGVFGEEVAAAEALAVSLSKRRKVNADVIPAEAWALIEAKKAARRWSDIARGLGQGKGANLHVGKRGLSRPNPSASVRFTTRRSRYTTTSSQKTSSFPTRRLRSTSPRTRRSATRCANG
jgi:replicative DNA helicase